MGDLPDPKQPRCALISGRTADNPRLFKECIDAKCSTIFLEKPGAPTVRFSFVSFVDIVGRGDDVCLGGRVEEWYHFMSWLTLINHLSIIVSLHSGG